MRKLLLTGTFILLFTTGNLIAQTNIFVNEIFSAENAKENIVDILDFNSDGELDAFVLKGHKLFLVTNIFDVRDSILITTGISDKDELNYKDICDIDNDGYNDLITANHGIFLYSPENRKFRFKETPFMFESVTSLQSGNLNGDDFPDIVVNSEDIYLTQEDLTFHYTKIPEHEFSLIDIADLNNDNFDDLILRQHIYDDGGIFGGEVDEEYTAFYYVENIQGTFPDEPIRFLLKNSSHYWNLTVVPQIGYNNLAVFSSEGLLMLKNKGNFVFDTASIDFDKFGKTPLFNGTISNIYSIIPFDADKDGIKDLFFNSAYVQGWVKLDNELSATSINVIDCNNNILKLLPLSKNDTVKLYMDEWFNYGVYDIAKTKELFSFVELDSISSSFKKIIRDSIVEFYFLSGTSLKSFSYKLETGKLDYNPDRSLLSNVKSYDVRKFRDSLIYISAIANDSILIYNSDDSGNFNLNAKWKLDWTFGASDILITDIDCNAIPDIIIITYSKGVYLFRDSLQYLYPKVVMDTYYSNTRQGKLIVADLNNDSKDEYILEETTNVLFWKDVYLQFFNSNFTLISLQNYLGSELDDYELYDWDNNGVVDFINCADGIQRYYFQNDTIVQEYINRNTETESFEIGEQPNGNKFIYWVDTYNKKSYYLNSFSGENYDWNILESSKKFSLESVFNKTDGKFSLLFFTNNSVSAINANSGNLSVTGYSKIELDTIGYDWEISKASFFDINSDNLADVVAETSVGLAVFYGRGGLDFSTKPEILVPHAGSYTIKDLDFDGDLDLFGGEGLYRNDTGSFKLANEVYNFEDRNLYNFDDNADYEILDNFYAWKITPDYKIKYFDEINFWLLFYDYKIPANLNNDGKTDFVLEKWDTIYYAVCLDSMRFALKTINLPGTSRDVYVEDINSDNYDDIVVVDTWKDSITVFLNQKNLTFKNVCKFYISYSYYDYKTVFYDFNQDGKTDIRMDNDLYINKGNGIFEPTGKTNRIPFSNSYADIDKNSKDEFLIVQNNKILLYQITANQPPALNHDLTKIQIGVGQYLKYKLPEDYIEDENTDLLLGRVYKIDFGGPYLEYNPLDFSIESGNYATQTGLFAYYLTLTDVNGIQVADTFLLEVVDYFVGVKMVKDTKHNFICYPNPVSDILHIHSYEEINENFDISIYNSHGQIVFNQKRIQPGTSDIPVQGLEHGNYIIVLQNNSLYEVMRFSKL